MSKQPRSKPDLIYHGLHLVVLDGMVYPKYDFRGRPQGDPIGALMGAQATAMPLNPGGHRRTGGQRSVDTMNATLLFGPIGLLAGISRKQEDRGQITIVFTNGNVLSRIRVGPLWLRAISDIEHFNYRAHRWGAS